MLDNYHPSWPVDCWIQNKNLLRSVALLSSTIFQLRPCYIVLYSVDAATTYFLRFKLEWNPLTHHLIRCRRAFLVLYIMAAICECSRLKTVAILFLNIHFGMHYQSCCTFFWFYFANIFSDQSLYLYNWQHIQRNYFSKIRQLLLSVFWCFWFYV